MKTKTKIRLASFAQRAIQAVRRLGGGSNWVQCRRDGLTWRLDLDEGVDFAIYLLGGHEKTTLRAYRRLAPRGGVFIDIGANIGSHTLPLAAIAGPEGRVLAVEPTRYAFEKLTANLALNPQEAARVTTVQAMLAASEEVEVPEAIASSWPILGGDDLDPLMCSRAKSTEGARAVTLDRLMAEVGLSRVDFIKLDVDGFELTVLQGAEETLQRARPRIMLELADYTLRAQGASLQEMLELLRGHGYALYTVGAMKPLPREIHRLLAMLPEGASLNAVALPEGDPLRR